LSIPNFLEELIVFPLFFSAATFFLPPDLRFFPPDRRLVAFRFAAIKNRHSHCFSMVKLNKITQSDNNFLTIFLKNFFDRNFFQ